MEYLWMIFASLGAGIGTGLAGLSAATVMVPILITLCPGFAGETGAYQATAIALVSDILGSAVTAMTYAKNKNIDLKRGWIMMLCILSMCTVGSYVAWLAGNVVLGCFTLFLTFFIGIRFLVRPDTTRKDMAEKGKKFTWKEIAVSLFFGLTIGFGTGFVGTGGGMMMLIVFTAFLGMDLKSAVGTSTFIMTFTALIASVSHILIHPAIVLEQWGAMLICITVTTAASLFSARFANRVRSRTVGLVTGAVLTLLGAAMLILHFRSFLSGITLFVQILGCLGRLAIYIGICLTVLLPVRFLTKVPQFVFRKLLHIVAFSCITVMIMTAGGWLSAALSSVIVAVTLYPVLKMLENEPWYSRLFVEKSKGEIKRSLLMLFFMFAVLVAVSWGAFGNMHACVAAILMWGIGDAAAALFGIPFGKHKVVSRLTDGKKSWEGTAAMFTAASLIGFVFLSGSGALPVGMAAIASVTGSAVGAGVELISGSEYDTVTVPAAIIIILLLF